MHARISYSGSLKTLRLSGLLGISFLVLSPLRAQDAKFAADNLKYSRDCYSKVHFVAIAKLDFGPGGTADFKYDIIQTADRKEYSLAMESLRGRMEKPGSNRMIGAKRASRLTHKLPSD
jgi:hypothetical protein